MHFGCEEGSRGEALAPFFAPSKSVENKKLDLQPEFLRARISGNLSFRD
jgi:hypothetical protein